MRDLFRPKLVQVDVPSFVGEIYLLEKSRRGIVCSNSSSGKEMFLEDESCQFYRKNIPWCCGLQYFPCTAKCRVSWLLEKLLLLFQVQRKALFLKRSPLFQTTAVSLMKGYSFYPEMVSPVLD